MPLITSRVSVRWASVLGAVLGFCTTPYVLAFVESPIQRSARNPIGRAQPRVPCTEIGALSGQTVGALAGEGASLWDDTSGNTVAIRQPAGRSVTGETWRPSRVDSAEARVRDTWDLALLNMASTWARSGGGQPSVVVAVLDTGLTVSHAVLSADLWTGQAFDRVSLTVAPGPALDLARVSAPRDELLGGEGPPLDLSGHGTHLAAVIAARATADREPGTAYNVSVMPVKVCAGFWDVMFGRAVHQVSGYPPVRAGGCPDDAIVRGLKYAVDHGARVITLGLSGPLASPLLQEALRDAVRRGAFVAIAAGDVENTGPGAVPYPAGYASEIDGVVAVGAIDSSQRRASYSSVGRHVEIAAPGGDRGDARAADRSIRRMTLFPADVDASQTSLPRFDRFAQVGYSGTSIAAAHVSAVAALLVSRGVADPVAIERILKDTARDLGRPGRDDEFGYGLIQPLAAIVSATSRR